MYKNRIKKKKETTLLLYDDDSFFYSFLWETKQKKNIVRFLRNDMNLYIFNNILSFNLRVAWFNFNWLLGLFLIFKTLIL